MLGGRMLRRYRLTLAREAIFCSCAGAVDRCASKLYQRHGCQVPTRRMKEKKQQQRSPNHTPNNTKNLRGKRNGRYNSCFFSLIVLFTVFVYTKFTQIFGDILLNMKKPIDIVHYCNYLEFSL
jgi:hypothetical protein